MGFLAIGIALVVGIACGFFIGLFVGVGRMKKAINEQSVGCLRIDRSVPDEPPMPFLEVKSGSIEAVARRDFVVLKVVNENYLSHD